MLLFISSVSTFLTSHAHSQHCLCPGRCRGAACHPHSQTRGRGWRGGRTPTRAAPLAFIGASLKYANKRGKRRETKGLRKGGKTVGKRRRAGPPLADGLGPPRLVRLLARYGRGQTALLPSSPGPLPSHADFSVPSESGDAASSGLHLAGFPQFCVFWRKRKSKQKGNRDSKYHYPSRTKVSIPGNVYPRKLPTKGQVGNNLGQQCVFDCGAPGLSIFLSRGIFFRKPITL